MQMIKIPGVSEWDIDRLLAEEFTASPEFGHFVLGQLGLDGKAFSCCKVACSVTHSMGESDVEVLFKNSSGQSLLIMIENKVRAGFQPSQAKRYRKRGNAYVKNGKADEFKTVLIAPKTYFNGGVEGFDHRLHYEQLIEWFEGSKILAGRKHYKKYLLKAAIEKSSKGYQLVEDKAVTDFWAYYWKLSREIAPEFKMRKPGPKPSKSDFIYFYDVGLPNEVYLVHKVNDGYFDIQCSHMGERMFEMYEMFECKLTPEMRIERAQKSASIRIDVPKLFTAHRAEEQYDNMVAGMEAGKKLLAWGQKNLTDWMPDKIPAGFPE